LKKAILSEAHQVVDRWNQEDAFHLRQNTVEHLS